MLVAPLALETCARRLAPLELQVAGDDAGLTLRDGHCEVRVEVDWHGPAALGGRAASEGTVQAMSGLMLVHGRDAGGPRRLGLELASVTAGILAAQAGLAALVGQARGGAVDRVETSVLEAALLHVSHRLAAATAGGEWVPVPAGPAPGPPFRSSDGHWLEIETLDASVWREFWTRIGAGDADLQRAWRLFRPRYFRGTCTLPPGLHEAMRARSLADLEAAAGDCGVSLIPVRTYDQVRVDPGFSAGYPEVAEVETRVPERLPSLPEQSALPLAGIRVIEASSRLQGPLAGRLLQLLGAHVVRIEPPGGDLSRSIPPAVGDAGSFFLAFNRGKEFVELDLARDPDRARLRELAAGADVFLHNLRPDKAAEWGVDSAGLRDVNPALVHVQGSGWGMPPAVTGLVGTDFMVQAYAGVAAGISPAGRPPLPSRALLTDYMGALSTAEAALFGLYRRARDGLGQTAGGSLLAGGMALQAHVLDGLETGRENGRRDGRPVWSRLDEPLATADGLLALSAPSEDVLHRLCAACGVEPVAGEARACVEARISERLAAQLTGDWEERLAAEGIPCAAVCIDLARLPADPRFAGLFEPLGDTAWAPVSPWRFPR